MRADSAVGADQVREHHRYLATLGNVLGFRLDNPFEFFLF